MKWVLPECFRLPPDYKRPAHHILWIAPLFRYDALVSPVSRYRKLLFWLEYTSLSPIRQAQPDHQKLNDYNMIQIEYKII